MDTRGACSGGPGWRLLAAVATTMADDSRRPVAPTTSIIRPTSIGSCGSWMRDVSTRTPSVPDCTIREREDALK